MRVIYRSGEFREGALSGETQTFVSGAAVFNASAKPAMPIVGGTTRAKAPPKIVPSAFVSDETVAFSVLT